MQNMLATRIAALETQIGAYEPGRVPHHLTTSLEMALITREYLANFAKTIERARAPEDEGWADTFRKGQRCDLVAFQDENNVLTVIMQFAEDKTYPPRMIAKFSNATALMIAEDASLSDRARREAVMCLMNEWYNKLQ
jgi:hypothetical protein